MDHESKKAILLLHEIISLQVQIEQTSSSMSCLPCVLPFSHQAKLAAVDATKERALSDKFDIRGYPTLKHFLKGGSVIKDFLGARTKDGIIAAVTGQTIKDEL